MSNDDNDTEFIIIINIIYSHQAVHIKSTNS